MALQPGAEDGLSAEAEIYAVNVALSSLTTPDETLTIFASRSSYN
jgi:hypothetical protein